MRIDRTLHTDYEPATAAQQVIDRWTQPMAASGWRLAQHGTNLVVWDAGAGTSADRLSMAFSASPRGGVDVRITGQAPPAIGHWIEEVMSGAAGAAGPRIRPVNPLGPALACVAALLAALGTFLPASESASVLPIKENSLIQHGDGIVIALLAVVLVIVAARAYRLGKASVGLFISPLIILAFTIYDGASKAAQTLYPLDGNGDPITSGGGIHASPGIGIWICGAGAVLALIASAIAKGWIAGSAETRSPASASPEARDLMKKTCPDCAEQVMAAARICKHCGYAFDAATSERTSDTGETPVAGAAP